MPRGTPRSTPAPITIAFGGPTQVTERAVQDQLNDLILLPTARDPKGLPTEDPGRAVKLIIPVVDSVSPGIEAVLDYSAWADLPYTTVTTNDPPSDRGVRSLIREADEIIRVDTSEETDGGFRAVALRTAELLADGDGEAVLVGLWGKDNAGDSTEDTLFEELLDAVVERGLPAVDLAAGMEPLVIGDEPAPEQAPEPVAEEKPARRSRRSAPERLVHVDEPLTDDSTEQETPAPSLAEKIIAKTKPQYQPAKADEAQAVIPAPAQANPHAIDLDAIYGFHPGNPETIPQHEKVREGALAYARLLDEVLPDGPDKTHLLRRVLPLVMWTANAAIAMTAPLEAKRSPGRPRADGTPAQRRTAADTAPTETQDPETGEWERRGRGRPRAGAATRKAAA